MFADLKERYPRTAYAQQAGMLAAKLQFDKGKADDARGIADLGRRTRRRRRLQVARAACGWPRCCSKPSSTTRRCKQLDAVPAGPYAALAADRRGDVLLAQGKKDEARAAYQQAFKSMDDKVEYRRLVDAKLTALGAAPAASAAQAAPGASR